MRFEYKPMGLNSGKDKHKLVIYAQGTLSSVKGDPFCRKIRIKALNEAMAGCDKLKESIKKEILDLER